MSTSLTLYQLTNEFVEIQRLLEDNPADIDEQMVKRIEALELASGKKLDGYIDFTNYLKMMLVEAKKQAGFWEEKEGMLSASLEYMNKMVKEHFISRGIAAITAESGRKIILQGDGGLKPLVFDEMKTPDDWTPEERERFLVMQPMVDRTAIRKALEAGETLSFVEFGERGKHIRYY